jgi:hypothetical protein
METRMTGPSGQDPNQAWSSGGQPPTGPEESSTWQQPAYPQSEPYAPAEQYPGPEFPATEQYPGAEAYPGTAPQPEAYPGTAPQPEAYPGAGTPYPYGQPTGYDPSGAQYPLPGAPFGEPPAEAPPQKGSKGKVAVLAGIGVLVLALIAVGVTGFWKPGYFVTTKLDVAKAQEGVAKILTDDVNGYGLKDVKDVKCNSGQNPTVKKDGTFECDATIEGQHRKLTVTFQDNSGTYEVGRPKIVS